MVNYNVGKNNRRSPFAHLARLKNAGNVDAPIKNEGFRPAEGNDNQGELVGEEGEEGLETLEDPDPAPLPSFARRAEENNENEQVDVKDLSSDQADKPASEDNLDKEDKIKDEEDDKVLGEADEEEREARLDAQDRERDRCASIFSHKYAAQNPVLAAHLAFGTNQTRQQAAATLRAASFSAARERKSSSKASSFGNQSAYMSLRERMGKSPVRPVNSISDTGGEDIVLKGLLSVASEKNMLSRRR